MDVRLKQIPYVASYIVRNGFIRGSCPVCARATVFYLKGAWIRGDLRCIRCDSRPRNRALIEVLDREFRHWRTARIHESSPGGSMLEKFRRECPGYTPSHFFPDVPRGEARDGFRSESLEEQSFDDEAFDLVITQDVMEHVLRPAPAFSEIARTLKPGGAHVFTVPWYYWRPTSVRARLGPDGRIEHLLEPDYHGNPLDPSGGSLVVTDWGRELLDFIHTSSKMKTEVFRLDDAKKGITGAFIDVFVSRKPLSSRDAAE